MKKTWSKQLERACFALLAIAMCGVEAWRPFESVPRHIVTEVLSGIFALVVGVVIGFDLRQWSLSVLVELEQSAQRLLAEEERAHQAEYDSHEETIQILQAVVDPAQPLEEARSYLKGLELKRYEPDEEDEETASSEGEVH